MASIWGGRAGGGGVWGGGEGMAVVMMMVERKPEPIPVLMGVERDAKPKNPVLHLKSWEPFL